MPTPARSGPAEAVRNGSCRFPESCRSRSLRLSLAPQLVLQGVEPFAPKAPDVAKPRVDLADAVGIERVDAPLRLGAHTHQPRLPQHLQMLRDRRRAHVELPGDVAGGTLAACQHLDDLAPDGGGECGERDHGPTIKWPLK